MFPLITFDFSTHYNKRFSGMASIEIMKRHPMYFVFHFSGRKSFDQYGYKRDKFYNFGVLQGS